MYKYTVKYQRQQILRIQLSIEYYSKEIRLLLQDIEGARRNKTLDDDDIETVNYLINADRKAMQRCLGKFKKYNPLLVDEIRKKRLARLKEIYFNNNVAF